MSVASRRGREGSIEEPLTVLAELKSQGLIRHIGVDNVTPQQFREAQNHGDGSSRNFSMGPAE